MLPLLRTPTPTPTLTPTLSINPTSNVGGCASRSSLRARRTPRRIASGALDARAFSAGGRVELEP